MDTVVVKGVLPVFKMLLTFNYASYIIATLITESPINVCLLLIWTVKESDFAVNPEGHNDDSLLGW